jgi:hypothetical protein
MVSITIGEVDNDDAMTRNASFTTHVRLRAKKLGERQDGAGMDKIAQVLLGDLWQIAWIIRMCEGRKAVVQNCRVCQLGRGVV